MPGNFRSFIQAHPVPPEILGNRHFLLTLLLAFVLHVMAAYVWHLMPRPQVIDIPVRALNIKLGDGTLTADERSAIEANTANKTDVENTISRLVREQSAEVQARSETMTQTVDKAMAALDKPIAIPAPSKAKVVGKFDVRSEGNKAAAPVMAVEAKQFVRDLPAPVKSKLVSKEPAANATAGNSNAKDAEMISRYEQTISLWIQKFKIYPESARAEGMQGSTVVRIRIDRRGNVRYYQLENSTGYLQLDRAAIDMIRRANPVPAVPNDYPKGDLLEFLIPVSFEIK